MKEAKKERRETERERERERKREREREKSGLCKNLKPHNYAYLLRCETHGRILNHKYAHTYK